MRSAPLRIGAFIAAAALAALAQSSEARKRPEPSREIAAATLKDAAGANRGTATLYQRGQEVRLAVLFTGAVPGKVHGVHLHRIGRCAAPDFASAGEHWNPYRAPHGLQHPQGGHAGDLPNLLIGADGSGRIDVLIDGIALTEGRPPLVNTGAVVVHAEADDMKSDPSGNSGARIACGALGGDQAEPPASAGSTLLAPLAYKLLPPATVARYVTQMDYPEAARRKREQGTTTFRITVGPNGRVTDCTIVASSGSSNLDAATCRLVRSRMRVEPTRNARGEPEERFEGTLNWRLP